MTLVEKRLPVRVSLFLLLLLTALPGRAATARALERAQPARWTHALKHLVSTNHTVVIGIGGGSASGKTTLAKKLVEGLGSPEVGLVSQDWYFLPLKQPKEYFVNGHPNYDHPSAMDFPLMRRQLTVFKQGGRVEDIPDYDYNTSERSTTKRALGPYRVVVFEGIHALEDPELRRQMDLKIFVDLDSDVRLGRRVRRDIVERGKDVNSVLNWYFEMVKPMHDRFIEPSKAYADMIVPGDLSAAEMSALTHRIRDLLAPRLHPASSASRRALAR